MRVLALLPNAYDDGGGIAQYNRDWLTAVALSEKVSEIRLCCLSDSLEKNNKHRPKKISKEKTLKSKWQFSLAAISEVKNYKPDIIFCGHLGLLKLMPWLPKNNNARLWLQLHGIEAWPIADKKIRRIASKASLVTCVSRFTRGKALAWLNIEPELLKVLPNTFNEDFCFKNIENKPEEYSGKKILLTVGRLSAAEQYKGQDKVIAALPEILRRHADTIYLIAGTGDDEIRLRSLAKSTGVQSQVKFLGYVGNEDLPNLYRLADLYVMPSTGEGFGIAYLEAMACGTPALGLNVDGSVDPLANGEMGICLDKELSLAQAIVHALEKPNDKAALSAAVKNRFGRNMFNQQVAGLLELPNFTFVGGSA